MMRALFATRGSTLVDADVGEVGGEGLTPGPGAVQKTAVLPAGM